METALELVRDLEQIHARWRDTLRCAQVVDALDRDADDKGYDARLVVSLHLQSTAGSDTQIWDEAVALCEQGRTIGRFIIPDLGFSAGTVPAKFSTGAQDCDAGIDVVAVRGFDWSDGDFDYREEVVAAVLGGEYHLGFALPW